MKVKLISIGLIIALLIGFGFTFASKNATITRLNNELLVAENNNKAYEAEKDSLNKKTLQFQYTIDQLNYSNDSLVRKINDVRKQLKLKDKEITELQYFASQTTKRDSIVVHDSIFVKGVALDTLIEDYWSRLAIHAEYPNLLDIESSFRNETTVVLHTSRVTIDPPKKCKLLRWFQKKQDVVEVDVVQENPYCVDKEKKFIKIIK